MGRIVVIGSLNMDLVVRSPRMPLLGETLTGRDFMTCPGGKGSNQAVAAARLGGTVAMIGSVGDDLFGQSLLAGLKHDKIDHSGVRVRDAQTGTATIVVIKGDNFIILDPGANGLVIPADIESHENLIKKADLVMLQLEIPLETVEFAIELAHRHNVPVMLDPAPAVPLKEELLAKLDIFKPNEHECMTATGIPVKDPASAMKAVVRLHEIGIRLPIVTMGKMGVVYYDEQLKAAVHQPAHPVDVVDTTAAGDCFSGALAVALTEGMTVGDSVVFASRAAALTTGRMGAQPSLPHRHEL